MNIIKTWLLICLTLIPVLLPTSARAQEVRIAVASNFKNTMTLIIEAYQQRSQTKIIASYGSTGKHYAQIVNGAPFDIFYAADDYRPTLLVDKGFGLANTKYIYAIGKLVLWSTAQEKVDSDGETLMKNDFRYLALANKQLSPYGVAADQVLSKLNLEKQLTGKLIKGENIAQTFQFVDSGNADLGFIAYSQIANKKNGVQGSYWLVPQDLYQPIVQQAIMINETTASSAFFNFTKSQAAREIIRQAGYELTSP